MASRIRPLWSLCQRPNSYLLWVVDTFYNEKAFSVIVKSSRRVGLQSVWSAPGTLERVVRVTLDPGVTRLPSHSYTCHECHGYTCHGAGGAADCPQCSYLTFSHHIILYDINMSSVSFVLQSRWLRKITLNNFHFSLLTRGCLLPSLPFCPAQNCTC